MAFQIEKELADFYIIGVNHSCTAVSVREQFALTEQKQQELLEDAKSLGVSCMVVLSTCNRTEIYSRTDNPNLISRLIAKHTKGSMQLLEKHAYVLNGEAAVQHLYRVGAGLDSQILGDFQIIGQLKAAYRLAERLGTVDTLLNRVFSHIFQASKKVKNQTELSNGTASVAHAAVQFIRENATDIEQCKLLLYGTGEIGKITCDNLVRHLHNKHLLTLVNRNKNKAAILAEKYQVSNETEENLAAAITDADIIVVATASETPTVKTTHFTNVARKKIVLDLSVPRNVEPEVNDIKNVQLIDVDQLSQINNETLKTREESIPTAEKIIQENYEELKEWLEMQHLSPIFKGIQQGLERIKEQELSTYRGKFTDEEYEKAELVATNIANRIAKMGILHLKDVFKNDESSMGMLKKMFSQYANPHHSKMPKGHPHHIKKTGKNEKLQGRETHKNRRFPHDL